METIKRLLSPAKNSLTECTIQKKRKIIKSTEINEDFKNLFDDDFDVGEYDKENIESNSLKHTKIQFNIWQRCIVKAMRREARTFDLVLELVSTDDIELKGECRLQGPWCHTKVQIDDIVSIVGHLDTTSNCYVVNGEIGFIVVSPDNLISSTSVVGSLFCQRKGILQDRFRGVEGDNKVMVIGSLVHELLQIVLRKELKTFKDIEQISYDLIRSQGMAMSLFLSKITVEETELEITKFIPNIVNFVNQYVDGNYSNSMKKDMFQGMIDDIQDIEENLWIPQLGLKGKVDVSVNVRRRKLATKKLMPLELKTGRASFSSEHKGQVILYQMMLNEIGRETHSGLLLYLRDGILKEIPASRNEQRDLIILRNELAYYLSQNFNIYQEKQSEMENLIGKFQTLELPEPINHHSACSKCAYNTICCSFLKTDKTFKLKDSHPLYKVSQECTSHLKNEDLEYFINWCGMLSLEDQEIRKSNQLKSLWTETSDERFKKGKAIVNLKIAEEVVHGDSGYIHVFQINNLSEMSQYDTKLDLTLSRFTIGNYVIVSTTKRISVAAGYISDLSRSRIVVCLERNLKQNYSDETFIIDTHESQNGYIFNYTNLGLLLEDSERSNRLRSIVIDRKPPIFSSVLPKIIAKKGTDILVELNSVQRKAVIKALTTDSFLLIKGLPGTGKTQTLIAIIRLLSMIGKSILITSHTNSAVDNVLLRLKQHNLKFLRIGSTSKINSKLQEFSESFQLAKCKSSDDLAKVYSSFNIVGVTCLGSNHAIFTHRTFDVCIVDEATQVYQATVLRPLFFSNKFILVGDPEQLPPLVRSVEGRRLGSDESLFHRLDSSEATYVLTLQYRMNKMITKIANDLTYNGELKCGNETVMMASLTMPQAQKVKEIMPSAKWIHRTLEKHIDQSVFFLNTENCLKLSCEFAEKTTQDISTKLEDIFPEADKEDKEHKFIYTNYCDAAVCLTLIKALLIGGYNPENIGVIAPYRAQVELLRKLAEHYQKNKENLGLNFVAVEVNTVDQYQGRDKEIIIYSCTKTGKPDKMQLIKSRDNQILEDKRRLTVAITRSKHKLIIIGDEPCLSDYTPFKIMFSKIPSRCKMLLEDGKFGFSWRGILDDLSKTMNS